ncbi:hypothetical protein Tco_0449257 [Tanacetum coccineum]
MPTHTRTYIAPCHTKKIFENMRRVGKGFSGREIPLFPTMMVQAQEEMGEGSAIPTDPQHTPTITQPSSSQPQKKQRPRKPSRKNIEVPQPSGSLNNVVDKAIYKERDDSLVRAATIATSLDVEQDKGDINKTQSKATPSEPSSLGTSSGGGPRPQETIGDTSARTRRVKKLEKKDRKRTHKLKRLYKVGLSAKVVSFEDKGLGKEDASKQRRIADIDADAGITLDSTHFDADTDMFGVQDLDGDEVIVKSVDVVKIAKETVNDIAATVSNAIITEVNITLAQALAELKSAKPKATPTLTTTTAASTRPTAKGLFKVQDKGKGIMVEEPLKIKKKDQISFDEQEAKRLQAEFDEEAKIETDFELAQRLQAEEQE